MIYTENYISNQIFNGRDKAQIRKGNVIIGNGCWIGAYVFIREGVTIGDNVVVGAHSVVTKNIPSYSVAVGVPARVVKKISH
jgi:acetyltransferase-like isoleucine patch superfamily enzyme